MTDATHVLLVLASSSPYRQSLLARLGIDFICHAPEIDETARPEETARQLVQRLALSKARKVAEMYPKHLIIGSDQVASMEGQLLGKPGTREQACRQLTAASGKTLRFETGICLFNAASDDYQLDSVPFDVTFRNLTPLQVERYVEKDQPLDCAGSFKWESLGISLFEKMQGEDVTALEGLPLIRLVSMLAQEGIQIP